MFRLDHLHVALTSLYGRNVMAPILSRPSQILDLGTGSGTIPTQIGSRELTNTEQDGGRSKLQNNFLRPE